MSLQILPGRLDFESYAGDDFEVILSFTEGGAAYNVTAADFSAVIKRAGGDVAITVAQEAASKLLLSITDTDLGTSVSQDRWELRHTSTDRTWLAGDFVVSLAKGPGGTANASVTIDTSTVNVALTVAAASVAGVTDHGELGGLTDDDHTQYALADGSRGSFEASGAVAAHTGDTSDAHDASAISIADAGGHYTGTDVEAALQELGASGGGGSVDVVSNVAQDTILGRVSVGSGNSEELTAAQVRTLLGMVEASATRAYKSASAQSIPHNAQTVVSLDAESFDDDGLHDTATNNSRITVATTGRYRITAQIEFASDANGDRLAQIFKNGTSGTRPALQAIRAASGATRVQVDTGPINLTAGDYVELVAFQTAGVAVNALNGENATWLSIERVG